MGDFKVREIIRYPDGMPVKIQLLSMKEYPWHTHDDIQIVYVLKGELELKLTYAAYHLPADSIHFIHSDDVHGFRSLTEDNLVLLVNINMDYFQKFFPGLATQLFTTNINTYASAYKQQLLLKSYIFAMVSELYKKGTGYQQRITDIAMDLIKVLHRNFRGFVLNREEKLIEHSISNDLIQMDRISRVVSFVYANYPYKLSLSSIASDENINLYYLSHLFQRFVGESFRNFVSMVRVEMSESMLLSSDASVSQISQDIGFSNPKYYVENFERWFGYHPKVYRELFASRIIGRAQPVIRELPLEEIKDRVTFYLSQFPLQKDSYLQVLSANVDFEKPPIARMEFFEGFDLLSEIKTISALMKVKSAHSKQEPAELYYKTSSQGCCISLLKELIQHNTSALQKLAFSDSGSQPGGLLAINGLKKPLYYLYCFLKEFYTDIIETGPSFLASGEGNQIKVLAFNESQEDTMYIDFNFLNMKTNYKLTEKKLVAANTCIDYWCKLNFQNPIEERDFHHIEAMSAPRISFEVIPKAASCVYHCTLNPQDILLLELDEMN